MPDATNYASWPIKELRRFLAERGESAAGITEKAELVAAVQRLAAQVRLEVRVQGFRYLTQLSRLQLQPALLRRPSLWPQSASWAHT